MASSLPRRAYRRLRLSLPQPWSALLGAVSYSPKLLAGDAETRRELVEERLIERLLADGQPLEGIGAGLSERVVEVPWAMRAVARDPAARILDAGTAFAPMVYKRLLVRLPQDVELVDLADAELPGLRSHIADLRSLPLETKSFDAALCISTLEHVGMDNAQYGVASGGRGDVTALAELGRVARRVIVTVPGGADADMGWQNQYSPATLRRIAAEAGLSVARLEAFAHEAGAGWSPVSEDGVTAREYGAGSVKAAAVLCAELTSA
ncbi:MAG TPA: class I SAM-dependent methyltransferase [Solirubrobacteraceae bacterium]|jgi:hypothetical protein|nr:class I SAM-dependent methyltransferase [Solirubrobacteraceae bacterium]